MNTANPSPISSTSTIKCFTVTHIHELHNEDFNEYEEYNRFLESKEALDLPYSLKDLVEMELDISLSYSRGNTSLFDKIMATSTMKSYTKKVTDKEPVKVSIEDGSSTYVIVSDMTDTDEIGNLAYAMNHHWNIISVVETEFDPECQYVVSKRKFPVADAELTSLGYSSADMERAERYRHCQNTKELEQAMAL